MRNVTWKLAGVILALAAPPALAADTSTLTRTFDFAPGNHLELQTGRGHVEVQTGNRTDIVVTVSVARGNLAEQLDITFDDGGSDGLSIRGKNLKGEHNESGGWFSRWFGGGNQAKVTFLIEAPERMDLSVETEGGHVEIDDVEGEVSLSTGGGHISFGEVRGPLSATTGGGHIKGDVVGAGSALESGGGHIEVEGASGSLTMRTAGGQIEIGEVAGELVARTAGGHIQTGYVEGEMELQTSGGRVRSEGCGGDAKVRSDSGDIVLGTVAGHVQARTGLGDIRLTLASADGADLETDLGDIVVTIPQGAGFSLQARAYQVEVKEKSLFAGDIANDRMEGDWNGGGQVLRLRATGGDVKILPGG